MYGVVAILNKDGHKIEYWTRLRGYKDILDFRGLVATLAGLSVYMEEYPNQIFQQLDHKFINEPWPAGYGHDYHCSVKYVDGTGRCHPIIWTIRAPTQHLKAKYERAGKDINLIL